MGEIKERDYMFDTFRGLLMLSIPVSHFTKMSGNLYGNLYGDGFPQWGIEGFIYITINVFVMQGFMFLSGYFSKKPERARETAFKTFMWPYLVWTLVYFFVRMFFFGSAHLKFLTPPFALWFLFVLFFYRFFLKDMVKLPHLMVIALVMYFIVGEISSFENFMSLGRAFSYFPFFLLGYYCSKERLAWIRTLKRKPVAVAMLAAALVASSLALCKWGPRAGWYLLKGPVDNFPSMCWYDDMFYRLVLLALGCGWIVLMVNILPSKKGFLAFVGVNTMPVYIFHLTLRYVIDFYGLYVGFISCLVVAWFAVISLIYEKYSAGKQSVIIYAVVIALSMAAFYYMYASGCLTSLYGGCPENRAVYLFMVYGGALIAGCSFVAPFWTKLYDLVIEGPTRLPFIVRWLQK